MSHEAKPDHDGAPGSSTPRLEARDIVVVRDGRRVLDGATVQIPSGAVATIEGASGAGKSTLFRIIGGLAEPESGRVFLDGVLATAIEPRAYRRLVALITQQPPMLAGTVAENIATGPRLAGGSLGDREIAHLLARVGLDATFAKRVATTLSGGEAYRVAVARALALKPRVLLADEPTAGLDPAAASRVIALLREVASEGAAVFVITHGREHARALGGSLYALVNGRLERASNVR